LYVLGDGTLGGWHVDGRLNATGYGSENYSVRAPGRELEQGFAIAVEDGTGARWEGGLADVENGGSYDAVEFVGEYPVAEVRYRRHGGTEAQRHEGGEGDKGTEGQRDKGKEALPVEVVLRAYSPFCPLNAKESGLPCTVMRFSVTNRHEREVRGVLTGWLENGVEKGGSEDGGPVLLVNRVERGEGLTSVVMTAEAAPPVHEPRPERVLAGFEGERYEGWTAEGEAFGAGPARGTEKDQNPVTGFAGKGLVNSFRGGQGTPAGDRPTGTLTSDEFMIDRMFMVFRIGGGHHKRQTCMNLLVEGKEARSATGRASEKLELRLWDLREFAGKKARLKIVDAATGAWGHINVDDIRLVDEVPEELRRARADSPSMGTMCLSYLGKARAGADREGPARAEGDGPDLSQGERGAGRAPVGVVRAPFALKPGESAELVFVVSWHFPNLHTGQGQMYTNWFADALDVAKYVTAHDTRLWEQTELFRRTYYEDTTLPWWLALRLMMPTANLATGTAQWWKNGRFWGWEGVGCCHGTCTHVWNYSHAEARLFPELARSARVMQDFGTGFDAATGRVAFRGEADRGFEYAADGQSGTILKSYREHLCSPDDSFLKANWASIKKAMEFQIRKDAEERGGGDAGEADGMILTTQHNTYDINFEGANTFVGSLYLAALLAAAEMAERMGERETTARYREIARRGREFTERKLFNGEYFIQTIPADAAEAKYQYGDGCLADQLFGQTWARLLGLPSLYDEEKVRAALASVYKYNWVPAAGPYNDRFPPERYFVRERDGGMFVCTWPRGGRPGEPVRYRDEVWTGCEYQVAAGMIAEGLVDEGLVIVKAIDERYDGALHNPWNEVECGDHYARAMASWGVLQALMGFEYDGPRGRIGMSPRLTPEKFAGSFVGAEGWGVMRQERGEREQVNTVEVKWGRVRVAEFATGLPEEAGQEGARVSVSAGQGVGLAEVRREGARHAAVLREPIAMDAGKSWAVAWRW
jgi:uncharacterized protein (DUF608 family)